MTLPGGMPPTIAEIDNALARGDAYILQLEATVGVAERLDGDGGQRHHALLAALHGTMRQLWLERAARLPSRRRDP